MAFCSACAVGRTPWYARVPQHPPLSLKEPARAPAADLGVRPT